MFTSQARVTTDRAGRYLIQLCSHTGQLRHGHLRTLRSHTRGGAQAPPEVRGVEGDETNAVISFDRGRCVLTATGDALIVRAEASDPDQLRRIQDGVARRLERIGRRDRLVVDWDPVAPGTPDAVDPPQDPAPTR